jgi:hypothetical protein
VLSDLRKQADGVLVVSAGDDLTGPVVPASQRKLRAQLLLDGYEHFGVAAMALGEHDREPGAGLGAVKSSALWERAGIRLGVFALDLEGSHDPEAAVHAHASALRQRGARLVIALLHGGIARVRELLKHAPSGVDFAFVSHDGYASNLAESVAGTWLLEAQPQGKQFCQLDLHILDPSELTFRDVGMRGQLEAQLYDQEFELSDLAERANAAPPALHDFYARRRQQISDAMAGERKQLDALPKLAHANWLEVKQVPLGTEIADEPDMAALIHTYKQAVAKLPPPVVALPRAAERGFVGDTACRGCHAAAAAFWDKSKHARAWQSLVKKEADRDSACVGCHVTGSAPQVMVAAAAHAAGPKPPAPPLPQGLGAAGALAAGPKLPAPPAAAVGSELHDVQCEACHGPGAAHVAQPGARGSIVRDPPERICVQCHTKEQTTEWEFASFRAAVLGRGHGRK